MVIIEQKQKIVNFRLSSTNKALINYLAGIGNDQNFPGGIFGPGDILTGNSNLVLLSHYKSILRLI